MTLGRVLWIGWCTLWAVFWITLGWLFLHAHTAHAA